MQRNSEQQLNSKEEQIENFVSLNQHEHERPKFDAQDQAQSQYIRAKLRQSSDTIQNLKDSNERLRESNNELKERIESMAEENHRIYADYKEAIDNLNKTIEYYNAVLDSSVTLESKLQQALTSERRHHQQEVQELRAIIAANIQGHEYNEQIFIERETELEEEIHDLQRLVAAFENSSVQSYSARPATPAEQMFETSAEDELSDKATLRAEAIAQKRAEDAALLAQLKAKKLAVDPLDSVTVLLPAKSKPEVKAVPTAETADTESHEVAAGTGHDSDSDWSMADSSPKAKVSAAGMWKKFAVGLQAASRKPLHAELVAEVQQRRVSKS